MWGGHLVGVGGVAHQGRCWYLVRRGARGGQRGQRDLLQPPRWVQGGWEVGMLVVPPVGEGL